MIRFLIACSSIFALSPFAYGLDSWKGQQRALVLLVEWSNVDAPNTQAEMEKTFFDSNSLSLRKLFLENSVGTFDLTGDVKDWRRTNDQWDPGHYCNLTDILESAWTVFGHDINIADYDSDHDGKIDNLFVIHSGRSALDRVGPECTFVDSPHANHAIVFQSGGLGAIGTSIPIGFYVHEAGHSYFGFPDLYSNHYHGKYGIAMWGMMGLGAWGTNNQISRDDLFRYPAHFEPLSKVRIGWIKPTIYNTGTHHVVLRPVETSGDIVAIPAGGGSNYYLEYRSDRGFSAGHRGHGMLIWKNYTVIQADGRDDINHGHDLGVRPLPPNAENFGDSSDVFPGSDHVTTYRDNAAGFSMTNITQTDAAIEFDLTFDAGFVAIPYQEPIVSVFNGIETL